MRITIVIPTYNERENIILLLVEIFKILKQNKLNGHVIIVDDNSPDGTAEQVKRLSKKYETTLIERGKRLGLGSAYKIGFKKALELNSDLIFEMDADLSHDPEYIPKFLKKINEGYDVVIGSRLIKGGGIVGWNLVRRLISWSGNIIGRYVVAIDVSDLTSGYRVYRREVLQSIDLDEIKSRSYDFQLEILSKVLENDFKVGTIPIIFYDRKFGKSKLTKLDQLRFLITALKIRFGMI